MLWLAAVSGEDAPLRARARGLALAWLKDPTAIAPELVDPVLAAAATTNDEPLFTALVEKAKGEADHRKVAQLLTALGRFSAPALARKALMIWSGTAFDVRDSTEILRAQLAARSTRETAWQFLKASFDSVAPRHRSDEVSYEMVEVAKAFCDETHRADVKAFFEPRAAKYDGMAHTLATTVEAIGQCAAAFAKNRADLDAFLAKY
jgi:alanyl aminopeptidase